MKIKTGSLVPKILGLMLIILALVGIALSLAGVGVVWHMKDVISSEVSATLDEVVNTLAYADQSVDALTATLDAGLDSIDQLDASVKSARETLATTNHFFDTAAELTGKTLPDTLTSVQTAFDSAGKSAKVVDDTLNFIAGLPLIGGDYAPTVPMSEAMSEVARNLEPLAGTIKGIEDDVREVQGDMISFQTRLDEAGAQIQRIQESAANARQVITQTEAVLDGFSPRLKVWHEKLPRWIRLASYGICVYLLWMAAAQLGLLLQGIGMIFEFDNPTRTQAAVFPEDPEDAAIDEGGRQA